MPRRVEDIIPTPRASIRDIRPGPKTARQVNHTPKPKPHHVEKETKSHTHTHAHVHEQQEEIPIRRMPVTPPTERPRRRRLGAFAWIIGSLIVIALVAAAAYIASAYFARATFTIVPKVANVPINGTYVVPATASANATSSLIYEIMTLTATASTTVPATDGPSVQTKASGSATLYNAYSKEPLRLVAGTRFSNDSGLIYRLTSSVVIPGAKTAASGAVTPGSLSVTLAADQVGEQYNIYRSASISDFKVVAYKGAARYDLVYARMTSDISGGFAGKKKIVDPTVLASTTARLQNELSALLVSKIAANIPPGYIVYDKGYIISYSKASVSDAGKNGVVQVAGTLNGIMFKQTDFTARLVGQSGAAFGNAPYDTLGLETLTFSIANIKDFVPSKKTNLIMRLGGNLRLVGVVPVDELKKKFAGMALNATKDVLKSYGSRIDLTKSQGEITPSWVSVVPSDVSRINIVVPQK